MIPSILMIVAPILITATGGMICERSGVVNIALEGLMCFGAMAAATCHVLLAETLGPFSIPFALLVGALIGGLVSLIHAFAAITLNADQTISGTGINFMATGFTVFFCQIIFHQERTASFSLGMMPWIGGIYPTFWIAIVILGIVAFFMYKRPWGLRLRACGEHPEALASAGVSVVKMRYTAVILSGLLAGLAGGCLILTQTIQFTATSINGKGFIALAAVSFGRWKPLGILGSSLLFGTASALAVYAINFDALRALPSEFFNMLPYLITLITLVVFSGKDYAPRANGKPYVRG
jgi:simple sugar transport system permease protein